MESILLTRLTQTDSPPGQTESLHVIRLRLRHSIFSFSRFSLIRLFISHFIQFIPFMQTKNAQAQPSCTTPLLLVGVFNIKKGCKLEHSCHHQQPLLLHAIFLFLLLLLLLLKMFSFGGEDTSVTTHSLYGSIQQEAVVGADGKVTWIKASQSSSSLSGYYTKRSLKKSSPSAACSRGRVPQIKWKNDDEPRHETTPAEIKN